MKRTFWWLLCMIGSPLAAFFGDAALERMLERATLKPPDDITRE